LTEGALALVLHAHLPYVRSAKSGSLEEDWYFQALMECYLPLLEVLENNTETSKTTNNNQKITIGISPTLLALMEDRELNSRFLKWAKARENILEYSELANNKPGTFLKKFIQNQVNNWKKCNGDLIGRFAKLLASGVVDLLTCAATHGYLPLLRENPEAVYGQLRTGIREHERVFSNKPLGIWLPECAYYEGLDKLMHKAELKYAILDGHGLLNANPRPRYGIYSPICTKNGVAFFARDSDSTLPIWSASHGYPGEPEYREFHRDLGWDISMEKLNNIGLEDRRPLGLKLHKVTSKSASLNEKDLYDPDLAYAEINKHAQEYISERKSQIIALRETMGTKAILVAPFDAELFGHWWFEGPLFLKEIFKIAKKENIILTSLKNILQNTSHMQLCNPSPSSWGQGGYHDYWLNDSNSWIIRKWSEAGNHMVKIANKEINDKDTLRLAKQAARELLLSQSSDWSFILRAGTTTKLAKERINLHLKRFWEIINQIESKDKYISPSIENIEKEDCLFPLIDIRDWSSIN
tara:strand:- start:1000 stop:2574 length:1575 start_codon:yes stop_codon:yes gene_type:complete